MSEQKKVKNNAVEFWRIVFTIGVTFFHFNLFSSVRCLGGPKAGIGSFILQGGWVLGYFLFLTGYFMMASYMKKDAKGLIDHENAYKPAWAYFWSRIKGLMPAFFLGTLFVFIIRNIAVGTPISMYPVLFFRSIFEFLGLQQIGMLGYNDVTNNADLAAMLFGSAEQAAEGAAGAAAQAAGAAWPSGFRAGLVASNTPLWNGPGWYISAIIVVAVIMYWVLCKKKDFFIGIFCPAAIILGYGYYGLIAGESWTSTNALAFGLPVRVLRVIAGLSVGCLLYFVVDWLKKTEFSKRHKVLWNVLSIGFTAFILYFMWTGTQWNEMQNNAVLLPLTVIILVGDDVISNFLSKTIGGFSAYVGKLSLYWYISHWGWVFALPAFFPDMAYLPMAGLYVLLSFVTANIIMLIDDKCVKPLINKPRQKAAA